MANEFGGVNKLSVYPKLANPFNENIGYKAFSNRPGGGAYRVGPKEVLNASVNFDAMTRIPKIDHKLRNSCNLN